MLPPSTDEDLLGLRDLLLEEAGMMPDDRVLAVGPHADLLAVGAALAAEGVRVVAVADPATVDRALERARLVERAGSVRTHVLAEAGIPEPAEDFDIALALAVPDPPLLREVLRVLGHGGRLVVPATDDPDGSRAALERAGFDPSPPVRGIVRAQAFSDV